MQTVPDDLSRLWSSLLARLRREYALLPESEQRWLAERAAVIADCQVTLDGLFHAVDGESACGACQGACCGAGRHHLTLGNLLVYLGSGTEPPAPDFSRSCPFLGETGCRLPVAHRPYNCITFFCETLETRFSEAQQRLWQEADRTLRAVYLAIGERHPAGSLHGLWLTVERLGSRPLFGTRSRSC